MSRKKRQRKRQRSREKRRAIVASIDAEGEYDDSGSGFDAEQDGPATATSLSDRPDAAQRELARLPVYLNPIERIGGIIIAPARTLKFIQEEQDWAVPVGFAIATVALILSRDVGEYALDTAPDVHEFMRGTPNFMIALAALTAIPWFIQSAAIVGIARLRGVQQAYTSGLSVIGYARFPLLVGMILSTLLHALGEPGQRAAAHLSAGLAPLSRHPVLSIVLSNFNVPNLWGFILIVLAVERLTEMSRRQAVGIAASYSTLSILLQIALWILQTSSLR